MLIIRQTTSEQQDLLRRLGIERDPRWVWISSDGPIDGAEPAPRLCVQGPEGVPSTCPFPYPYSKKWNDYAVELVGVVRDLWYFANALGAVGLPWRWEDAGQIFSVELYYQRVRYRGSQLAAELITRPPGRDGSIMGAHIKYSVPERAKAWAGMDLILEGPAPGRGGRRRIEETDEAKIELGKQARSLKRAHPHWSWARIAGEVGAVEYEYYPDDRAGERKAQRVAGQSISRLVKRVNELDPDP